MSRARENRVKRNYVYEFTSGRMCVSVRSPYDMYIMFVGDMHKEICYGLESAYDNAYINMFY